jgi:hypothetical protein
MVLQIGLEIDGIRINNHQQHLEFIHFMSFTSCSSRICGKINSIFIFTFYKNTQFIDIIQCMFGCNSQNINS